MYALLSYIYDPRYHERAYHSRHTIGFGMYQGNTIQANTLFGERDLFIILYTMPKNFKNFKNWALRLKMQQQKIQTGTERV